MKQVKTLVALAILATLALAGSQSARAQGVQGRELFGVRLGGIVSTGGLEREFGGGTELELHFLKGIAPWLGVDVALCSHSFGPSNDHTKDFELLGSNGEIDLHFWAVSVGMVVLNKLHGPFTGTLEAGPGIYSVNTVLPQGFYDLQKTDNRFGVYAGAGVLMKITSGFMLNLNGKYHYVFVPRNETDTIYFYTGERSARFYEITIGVAILTG